MAAFATCPRCGEEVRRGTPLVDETGRIVTRWQHRDEEPFWTYRCPADRR